MSEGCPGCFQSAKGQKEAFEKIKKEAIEYSTEHKKAVAIYKEGNEFKYIDAFEAYANGYGPAIRHVVSTYHGTATT
jgi:uncharacterized protein (DUF2225 family)